MRGYQKGHKSSDAIYEWPLKMSEYEFRFTVQSMDLLLSLVWSNFVQCSKKNSAESHLFKPGGRAKRAINEKSTFFVLFSWNLGKVISSWGNHYTKVS